MYEIFKSVIASKSYNLEEMIKKINIRWVEDILTEEQREELIALAQTNADPSQSNAPLQKQIEEISKKQIALEGTVEKLSAMVQRNRRKRRYCRSRPRTTNYRRVSCMGTVQWYSTGTISGRIQSRSQWQKVGIHGSEQCLGTRCIWGRPEHLERSGLKKYLTHLQE